MQFEQWNQHGISGLDNRSRFDLGLVWDFNLFIFIKKEKRLEFFFGGFHCRELNKKGGKYARANLKRRTCLLPAHPTFPLPQPFLVSAELSLSLSRSIDSRRRSPQSAMSTQLTQSGQFNPLPLAEPALTVSDESQKAWHLFSLLLSLGRPAHSFELASICTFFHAPPELVRLLCQIPSSPIHLRSDLCVTPSVTSLVAFFKLLSNTNKNLVDPPRQLKIERAYYRKRKRSSDKHELLPLTKRRVDLYPEEGRDYIICLIYWFYSFRHVVLLVMADEFAVGVGCCSSWCLPRGIQNPCEKVC